jgi:hypothetical protein
MKYSTYDDRKDVSEAIGAYLAHGFAIIEGSKTPAISYAGRMIDRIKSEHSNTPIIGYVNVPNNGYFYFVYDPEVFVNANDARLLILIRKIDAAST